MVSVLTSGLSGWSSSPGKGHCVVLFQGNMFYSHSASLHPDIEMGTDKFNAEGWGVTLQWKSFQSLPFWARVINSLTNSFCSLTSQNDLYGANVIIFEGIMAFAYKNLRDVRQKFNNMVLIISFFNLAQISRILSCMFEILYFLVNGHEGVC